MIAFVGAPWTLLIYMLNVKKEKTKSEINEIIQEKKNINSVLNKLIYFLCAHIKNQIDAGANVVQIFDSWAGLIKETELKDYCYLPNKMIVDFCKKNNIPNICFPKGLGKHYKEFNKIVKPDGLSLDYEIDPVWAKNNLKQVVLQGGLNPKSLLKDETKLLSDAARYIQTFKDIPYIFNLGHGLLPETDPDRVDKLIKFYRNS